jgi:ABC-type branched-subunit amino acid transport system substrate-binding protein
MNHRNRRRFASSIAVVAAAAGLLTACGPSSNSASAYNFGAILPLSGQDQSFGSEFQEAIQLGTNYVNADLGLSKKMSVDYQDGQGLPSNSVTAMNELVNVNKSLGVFSGFSSVVSAIAPMANRSKSLVFNAGANSPSLSQLGSYVLNDLPLANEQIPAATQYVVGKLGLKKWAVVYSDETLGQSVQAAINQDLPKAGGTVVKSVSVSSTATDFSSQVAELRNTGADLIYFAVSSGTQIPVLAQQLRAAGVKAQFMSYGGTDIPEVLTSPDAQGMLFTTQQVNLSDGNAATKYLVSQFKAKYPTQTMTTAQVNYFNAALIIGTALKQLEADRKTVTGASLLQQIQAGHSYEVAGGTITFNSDGTTTTPIDVTKLESHTESTVFTAAG